MSFVTFGEIMLRLSPTEQGGKLYDTGDFAVDFAGSESNVASSLALLGNQVKFITRLPANPLGDAAIRSLRSYGIDTSSITRGGSRMGIYFIEQGSSIRPSHVVYDRAGSAISCIDKNEFDWQEILREASWLFISGITPALSDQCADETIKLVSTASSLGVKICFDFNFRRSLWKDRKVAEKIFTKVLEHTDLLCGNTGSLSDVLDLTFKGDNENEKAEHAIEVAQRKFGLHMIAFTVREHTSASRNKVSGILQVGNCEHRSIAYIVDILDRFGTGDAFAAGLLHGLNNNWDPNKVIQFATAAFALKHTVRGDQHTSSEKEIVSIMEGKISGHVIR